MVKKREKANYMIQSVSHAVDVLEELAKAGGEVGVTDLSKRLRLHKNNVFRLLATLELRGYVEQNKETEDYRLGVKSLQLGQSYMMQNDLVARALPIIKHLAEEIGETVSLAVMSNGQVQYPISVDSKRPVRVAPRIAVSFPAKQNAAGRLLTAHLTDAQLTEVLSENSPQDAAIRNQLSELRANGQIVDRGASEPDVVSIVRVVRGRNGDVAGALEVLTPQYRAKVEELMPSITKAAQELSTAIGGIRSEGLAASIQKEVIGDGGRPTASRGPAHAEDRLSASK